MKNACRWRTFAVTALTLAATAPSIYSAPPSADASERRDTLRAVEVSATTAARARVANAVFAVTAADIDARGITGLADALRRLPGANVRDYGGAGGLTTVSVRGLGASHTGVTVDGLPAGNCRTGAVDLSRYDLDRLQSVTLTAGGTSDADLAIPASELASASVLKLKTASLAPSAPGFRARAAVRGGSFGLIEPKISAGATLPSGMSLDGAASFMRADNRYPFTIPNGAATVKEKRLHNGVRGGRASLDAQLPVGTDGTRISFRTSYYDFNRQLPGAVTLYNPGSGEDLHERTATATAGARIALAPQWTLNAAAKYTFEQSLYTDASPYHPNGLLDERYRQNEVFVSVAAAWHPGHKWSAAYSADYAYNTLSSNRPVEQHPRRHAILQSGTVRFRTGSLTATARLLASIYRHTARRGDALADRFRLQPSASVAYTLPMLPSLTLRASYKSLYRMPSFAETYFGIVSAPTLKPERGNEFNIGVTWAAKRPAAFVPQVQISVDGYINYLNDKIIAIPRNMFLWAMTNLGKARGRGVDIAVTADFEVSPRHCLLLSATYSYHRVEPRTAKTDPDYGRQAAYCPKNSGSAALTYENPWVNVGTHLTAASTQYATNSNRPESRVDGYVDVGFAAYRTLAFGTTRLTLRADLINAFNRQYCIVARYPMPGRSWTISAQYEF